MTLRRRYILRDDRLVGVAADKRETELALATYKAAAYFMRFHYLRRPPPVSMTAASFVVKYKGKPSGAIMLGSHTGFGVSVPDELDFTRMWLSDSMPKFSETVVIGLLHSFIKQAMPHIKRLRAFSDGAIGNPGTIYAAANYVRTGRVMNNVRYRRPDRSDISPQATSIRSFWRKRGRFPLLKAEPHNMVEWVFYFDKRERRAALQCRP